MKTCPLKLIPDGLNSNVFFIDSELFPQSFGSYWLILEDVGNWLVNPFNLNQSLISGLTRIYCQIGIAKQDAFDISRTSKKCSKLRYNYQPVQCIFSRALACQIQFAIIYLGSLRLKWHVTLYCSWCCANQFVSKMHFEVSFQMQFWQFYWQYTSHVSLTIWKNE